MRGELPGRDVRAIREALNLPVAHFATVLGVHPSSVHRWEAAGERPVPIEGVAWSVLTALRRRVTNDAAGRKAAAKKGDEISTALITGGVLIALGLLVAFAAKDQSA